MGKTFKNIVNTPHKLMGLARKKIQETNPEKTVGKVARGAGVATTGVMQFLLWLTKYVTLDNHATRKIEKLLADMKVGKNKEGQDKAFSSFMKKYPDLSAHLIYYMMAVLIAGGTYTAVNADEIEQDIKSKVKEWKDNRKASELMKTNLNPQSPDFIAQCIALENITSIAIIYTETYRATPKVQPQENVWTHGFGMTWSPDKNGKMTIRDYADTEANRRKGYAPHKPAENRTKDYDLQETQQFLRDQVYPLIQKHMKREMTAREFIGGCVAGYQLTGHIDEIAKKLNKATTPQQVADAFITKTMYKYGGTPKRRWVCGMLAAGYINMNDILNADVDAFYGPDVNVFIRNGHFICDVNTIEYVMGIQKHQKTRDVVNSLDDGRLAMKQLGGKVGADTERTISFDDSEDAKKVSESMGILVDAQHAYDKGNYKKAIELYEQAIEANPDNMEAYSSLAIAHIKLGDKEKSIAEYERATAAVVQGNKRMNANRGTLYDADIKASSYYNAGTARERMADIYAAQGDAVAASANYKKALQNYKTALANAKKISDYDKMATYEKAISALQAKTSNRIAQFGRGSNKIKNAVDAGEQGIQNFYIDDRQNA